MGFPWDYPGVPIGILVDSHEVSMEPLWHFYGIPNSSVFFVFYWIFMRFLLDFYAISRGSMIFLWDCYGIHMVLPWGSFDNLMGLLWHLSGISMMFF